MTTVTDEDRKAAVEIMADRWNRPTRGNVLAGNCDHYIPVQVCARHRETAEARARLEGMEIMREAAVKVTQDAELSAIGSDFEAGYDACATCLAPTIRNLDPAAILEAHTRAKAMDDLIAGDGA